MQVNKRTQAPISEKGRAKIESKGTKDDIGALKMNDQIGTRIVPVCKMRI